jgi:hypothetical protein
MNTDEARTIVKKAAESLERRRLIERLERVTRSTTDKVAQNDLREIVRDLRRLDTTRAS